MPRSYINKERFGDFSFQQARKAQTPYILIKFHRFWVGDLWGEWCYVCNFASMSPTKILISQWSIILNLQASSAYPSLSSSRTTRWRSVTNIWVRSKIRSFLVWSCLLITLSNQIKYRQIWNNPCGPILALGWVKMSITRSQRPKWCKTSISVCTYISKDSQFRFAAEHRVTMRFQIQVSEKSIKWWRCQGQDLCTASQCLHLLLAKVFCLADQMS